MHKKEIIKRRLQKMKLSENSLKKLKERGIYVSPKLENPELYLPYLNGSELK